MTKPIGYTREMREIAKKNRTGLATVDVRRPERDGGSGTIQTPERSMQELNWFLAFAIRILSAGKTPKEAWHQTYGSPHCPSDISGINSQKRKPRVRYQVIRAGCLTETLDSLEAARGLALKHEEIVRFVEDVGWSDD